MKSSPVRRRPDECRAAVVRCRSGRPVRPRRRNSLRRRPAGLTGSKPDFPFFSSVLDARRAGPGFPANNLTPRGLVVNLGRGYWVGFDTDLLRVAACGAAAA